MHGSDTARPTAVVPVFSGIEMVGSSGGAVEKEMAVQPPHAVVMLVDRGQRVSLQLSGIVEHFRVMIMCTAVD